MSELELINHTKLNFAGSDLSRKHVGPMSDDTPRRSPSAFKGVASGRTGVLGGSRRSNQARRAKVGAARARSRSSANW
jgi:hypothetical protein